MKSLEGNYLISTAEVCVNDLLQNYDAEKILLALDKIKSREVARSFMRGADKIVGKEMGIHESS